MKGKASIEQRLEALERRLAALEGRAAPAARTPKAADSAFGLLDVVSRKKGPRYARGQEAGAVLYLGAVQVDDREYRWVREYGLPEVLDLDWTLAARTLECLGSTARLKLLRELLGGPRDRQQLQDALGDGSSGQLYHHLRDLQSCGLLMQKKRGEYSLVPQAVIPILTLVAAALDTSVSQQANAAPPSSP